MNLIELLNSMIPLSSALLSVIMAITTSMIVTKRERKKDDALNSIMLTKESIKDNPDTWTFTKHKGGNDNITMKINGKLIKIQGDSEDEIVENISKAIKKENLQIKSIDEKRDRKPYK